ncbi:hypothetical protein FFY77_17660 [Xanthomonas translucens pv. translucens]|nr:hypothetical protein [Xanthomonas translucens pv. translucens]
MRGNGGLAHAALGAGHQDRLHARLASGKKRPQRTPAPRWPIVNAWRTNGNGSPMSELPLQELRGTRPLSVMMAEQVQALREWARERTVPAD